MRLFLAVVAAILFTVGILIGLPGLVGILQVPVDIRPDLSWTICMCSLAGIPLMMLYNFHCGYAAGVWRQ